MGGLVFKLEFRYWPIWKDIQIEWIALTLIETVESSAADHCGIIGT